MRFPRMSLQASSKIENTNMVYCTPREVALNIKMSDVYLVYTWTQVKGIRMFPLEQTT